MPTRLENLKQARDNVAEALAAATNPATMKPNYSVDGVSMSHNEYLKMLMDADKTLSDNIARAEPFIQRRVVL